MHCCAILGSSSLWTSSSELILAAVVIVLSILVLRDCVSAVSPPMKLEAEGKVYEEVNHPVANVDEHHFPWEVAQVVVVRQPHEYLESQDDRHHGDVPFSIPGFKHASQKSAVGNVCERRDDCWDSIFYNVEEVADSPEVLEAVVFYSGFISAALWADPCVDYEHWSKRTNERQNCKGSV